MKSMNLSHNLSDVELDVALEKALKGIRPWAEPKRELPDFLAEKLRSHGNSMFDKVATNMLDEIQAVIQAK